MNEDRRLLVGIWLAVALAVAAGGFLVVRSLTAVPDLPGRSDPAAIYREPELLFEDPGLLGTAVERLADRAVRECMAAQGYDYRGPAAVTGFDDLAPPAEAGYGIAAGLPAKDPRLSRLTAAARRHRQAGQAAITGEHYEGGHWLGSFAVYLVTKRGH